MIIRCVLLFLVAASLVGCYGAKLELHPSSRLPVWLELPEGVRRDQVTIAYYVDRLPEGKVIVKARWGVLSGYRFDGIIRVLIDRGWDQYPKRYSISVGGIIDVYEKRDSGKYLYIVDD